MNNTRILCLLKAYEFQISQSWYVFEISYIQKLFDAQIIFLLWSRQDIKKKKIKWGIDPNPNKLRKCQRFKLNPKSLKFTTTKKKGKSPKNRALSWWLQRLERNDAPKTKTNMKQLPGYLRYTCVNSFFLIIHKLAYTFYEHFYLPFLTCYVLHTWTKIFLFCTTII